jgi:hypothetical protein
MRPRPVATALIALALVSQIAWTAPKEAAVPKGQGSEAEWPGLGASVREVRVDTREVIHPNFGGVGFHAFHHVFPATDREKNEVIYKRWRELNPSFARLNDSSRWDRAMMDRAAEHMQRMKETGTELYVTTWDPPDIPEGEARRAYARTVVDRLEYLVRERGLTNIHYYCMTNELSLREWGDLFEDLPTFKSYHQALFDALKERALDIKLLASDASPFERWWTIEWATRNMDEITGVYGGHHYINDRTPDDERFYPWFLSKLEEGVGLARSKGKSFILGEFGARQDGRTIDGVKRDVCIYWDTPEEPVVGVQLSEAAIAAMNAGVYAMGYWTFMDFPDEYSARYINKWGLFKCSGADRSTRDPYYAYGLLTKFFRGPSTVYRVETGDPRLRVAALQHHGSGAWSIAVVNRSAHDAPLSISLEGKPVTAAFRKYVYDPAHVPQNPFGDLQGPAGKVVMKEGQMRDTVGAGTLTVYTTAYDDRAPIPVQGLKVQQTAEGKPRLTWQANGEPDLCYYRVYRSTSAGFTPAASLQIGSTIAAEFVDETAPAGGAHYKVLAVDQSGNASE